ncbi:vWA domain-containing protein [Rudanella paleaurantiibacter]|nr:vWA domain-containing protein [Rudanella paleaurantiibacter]
MSQAVADTVNRFLQQLVIMCAKADGVRDYYYISVIGYGAGGVRPAFTGGLANVELAPLSQIANNPARIEERTKKVSDGAGGLVQTTIKFPIWFDATAAGGTPMREAFSKANQIIERWLTEHPNCFPPVVIHITDGESTDGDPSAEMQHLQSQASSDGNIILFNVHTSARSTNPISFTASAAQLPDQYALMLYNGASVLPDFMRKTAMEVLGYELNEGAKAFVLNGDIDLVVTAIEIGTRPKLLR